MLIYMWYKLVILLRINLLLFAKISNSKLWKNIKKIYYMVFNKYNHLKIKLQSKL